MSRADEPRLSRRLSGLSDRRFKAVVYSTALGLYLVGIWLHLPYGGGNVYSDITYVFQERVCLLYPNEYGPLTQPCHMHVPLLQVFSEYPPIVSTFMYVMGQIGSLIPGELLRNYYLVSSAVLAIPAFLSIRELMKILEIRGASRNRVLWYFVVTPTFIFMMLLNWYIIGVYLTLRGLRAYIEEGSVVWSGVLFGLSAASNFVTAMPALGLLFGARTMKERLLLAFAGGGTYALINAPFLILNSTLWWESWQYVYNWNIEDSWIGGVLLNIYSPYRHIIPEFVFGGFLVGMFWMRYRNTTRDPLVFAFVAMFGYTFSTYIYAPQMNVALLPFFVLLPVSSGYWEFLAFDASNSAIIILGISQVLLPYGISYHKFFHPAKLTSNIVFWIGVIRSLWEGKFVLWNRIPGSLSLSNLKRGSPTPAMAVEEKAGSGG